MQVISTKSALHFLDRTQIETEHGGAVRVWTDQDEWEVSTCTLGPSQPPTSQLDCSRPPSLTATDNDLVHLQGWDKIGDPILHIEVGFLRSCWTTALSIGAD